MKLFRWPGRTGKKAFTERVQAALQQQLPEARIEPTGELELCVVYSGGSSRQNVWLGRAYQEFCKAPAQADEIVSRWLRSLAAMRDDTLDADRIIPVVKDHQWLARNAQEGFDPWTETYNSELLLVFAEYRDALHFCNRKELDDLRIPKTQLRERAFANLRRVITNVSVTGKEGEYLLGAGGTIDASLLLLDDVTNDPRIELSGTPLVGVSDRDSFWVADAANPYAVFGIAARVARCYATEAYPISRQLFHRAGAQWQPVDPEREDEHHPIPNLNVIDIAIQRSGGADLAIVIASPLGADARSIYRLSAKLDVYLHEIGTEEWRREHGAPTAASTRVLIKLHRDSDPVIAQVLDAYREWVESRGAQLRVEALD